MPQNEGGGFPFTDILRLTRRDDEHIRLILMLDLGGDDIRALAGAAADKQGRADDQAVLSKAAFTRRAFDRIVGPLLVVKRIVAIDVAVKHRQRIQIGALGVDPDITGIVLDIEAARLASRGDRVGTRIDYRPRTGTSLVVRIGFLPGATPMFVHGPTVEHAGLLG